MAEMTHEDIERVWNSVVHFIPERQKAEAAVDFVKSLDDIGIEPKEVKSIAEYDPKLESAVDIVYKEDEEQEEELREDYSDPYDDD